MLQQGIGPRLGRIVTISTAGATEESALGRLRVKAHENQARKITSRHLRYADGAFVLHELALRADTDDPHNLRLVKLVNPLQTMAELRRVRASPSTSPGQSGH